MAFYRKPNRLRADVYLGRHAYFLTLCTDARRRFFTDAALVNQLVSVLRQTSACHGFGVYAYCFMPDHLHLVLTTEINSAELSRFVQAFKSLSAREGWKHRLKRLWQKGFYDHVLRDGESLEAAAWYVFENPVRAGLGRCGEDWPYSGSFVFSWPGFRAPVKPFVPSWKSAPRNGKKPDGETSSPLRTELRR